MRGRLGKRSKGRFKEQQEELRSVVRQVFRHRD